MKRIKTKLHGLMDYTLAFFLLLPWLCDYNADGKDTWILALTGVVVGSYSIITDYEYGIFKFLSMKVHLFLDVLTGTFLVLMPFLFPLPNYYAYWPIAIGVLEIVTIIFSSYTPYKVTRRDLDITKPA